MLLSAARWCHGSITRARAKLQGVYCVSHDLTRPEAVRKELEKLGFDLPVHVFPAVNGFSHKLQDSVLEHVQNGLVEPAALPPILVQDDWRRRWRRDRMWHHVRRSREAPGRKHGGWLFGLDLTRGALGHALSHLQLWEEVASRHKQAQHEKRLDRLRDAYLVLDDNCRFLPDFCKISLDKRLAEVPSDWDIIFLGGSDLLGAQAQREVSPGVLRLYPWFRAGPAYLLRASAAGRVLNRCTPLRWRLDCHLVGHDASRRLDASAQERIFGATRKPIGYTLMPPLVEDLNSTNKSEAKGIDEVEQRLMDELDAVIAWAMRLTDKPLRPGTIASIWHPDRQIEGHTNMVPDAMTVINDLAAAPNVCRICEIGFNGGHSTLRWLLRSEAKVHSFDLGTHHYARPAAMWLMNKFPGRFSITWGDSVVEVPKFVEANSGLKFDIISIDGSHDYHVARKDLEHLAPIANLQHNRILMDDTFLDDVQRAWDEMILSGHVEELQTYSGTLHNGLSYGFAVGHYRKKTVA